MINYSVDAEGIATIEWDYPGKAQNILNDASMSAYVETTTQALADPAVKGILVCSAKKDFIAGGDLDMLLKTENAKTFHAGIVGWNRAMRKLETGGKPVAMALNGTALGGGLEVALCGHYRVAADNPKARFGFPEVTLGLLPGAGGTQRTARLVGMMAAAPLLTEGKRIKARDAQGMGLIHAVVPPGDERAAARAWLLGEGQKKCPATVGQERFQDSWRRPQHPAGDAIVDGRQRHVAGKDLRQLSGAQAYPLVHV